MDNLNNIYKMLLSEKNRYKAEYFIPGTWIPAGYDRYAGDGGRKGEVSVNPYEFMADCIENQILSRAGASGDYLTPLGLREKDARVEPARSTIYSMFLRMFTSWEHGKEGDICPGTLLKAICRLPSLKELGIDIVYLLPIFKYGSRYNKGEIGSPYAIKDIYRLDENLHDPLLGDYSEDLIETEFKAFVEACHILGMKVMVDYAFRTVSRDSDLIAEHPDWFYWINIKHVRSFAAPSVKKVKKPLHLDDRSLYYLYTSKNLKDYLAQFVCSPGEADPEKWKVIVEKHRQSGENILDLIEENFGMTTAPGFSDVINDSQPPWTDVTYLRFFFDVHRKAGKYVEEGQPPYIMQDGVRLNFYPGEAKNTGLADYIAGVIPFYQERYGIDGARIDMGHALTPELNSEIIARAKRKNRNFLLWSEDFDPGKSHVSKENGFHFINGYTWAVYKDVEKPGFNKRLFNDLLLKAEIPVIASLETPDTPRAAHVHKEQRKMELLVLLNSFLPNTVQLINNGFEVMEIQPMNLGLDNTEKGRFVLEKEDPMYGRLAFFDPYRIHWLSGEGEWMRKLLLKATGLRKRFLDILSVRENYVEQAELLKSRKLTFIYYRRKEAGRGLFLLANRDFSSGARFNLGHMLPGQAGKGPWKADILYSDGEICEKTWTADKSRLLKPGEVVIGEVQYG